MKLLGYLYILVLILLMTLPLNNVSIKYNEIYILWFRGDYILHAIVCFPWNFTGFIFLKDKTKLKLWYLVGVFIVIGFELAQTLIPYRTFNFNDLYAGLIGLLLSWVIIKIFETYHLIKSKNLR